MKLNVLLFASYSDVLGGPSIMIDLPARATVNDLVAALRQLPGADRLPPAPMVAVNQRYAAGDRTILPDDELAIIPPVAGG